MKKLGYGANYKYAHDYPGNFVQQQFLPDRLVGHTFWQHCDNPSENTIATRQQQRWHPEKKD